MQLFSAREFWPTSQATPRDMSDALQVKRDMTVESVCYIRFDTAIAKGLKEYLYHVIETFQCQCKPDLNHPHSLESGRAKVLKQSGSGKLCSRIWAFVRK